MSLVELRQITKAYRMGGSTVMALNGIDLRIEERDLLAVVGPSGSGKSTLMHILGFLDTPTSGQFLFGGQDVSRVGAAERARIRADRIGFIFQAFNLLPRLNIVENVALPLWYSRVPRGDRQAKAMQALEEVGLTGRLKHRPAQLSGGERQRVAIARALVNEPELILADEPTGNLDSATATAILELLHSLHARGRTIVIVTHDNGIAARMARRVRMLDGILREEAGPQ